MYDVITFGSATMDIFAETKSERIMKMCDGDRCDNFISYRAGDKVLIDDIHYDIGGGGTNTAWCLHKLGIRTGYCGTLGHDKFGRDIKDWLKENSLAFLGNQVEAQTNVGIVLDSKQLHDRSILTFKDASNKLRFADIDKTFLQSTWFYFSSLVGDAYPEMIHFMRFAREKGIAVAFNPSSYQTKEGLDPLREAIEHSQLLVMNKQEGEMLVGPKSSRADICWSLRNEGAEIILITDGGHGATLLHGDNCYDAPSCATCVVETTGAGDCFASTFLAGLVMGFEPIKAFRLAFVNAEALVSKVGAKQGLLSKEEALARLESDEREIQVT